ncbi:MAG: hypothetical protein ACT4P5_01100 [Armatimonadota bacterium]
MQANPAAGTASMRVARIPMPDQQDIVNALHNGPSIPATVSYDVRWRGPGRRKRIRSAQHKFSAVIVENTSTIQWEAALDGVTLKSDPASASKNVYSLIGRERNGMFFG